MFIAVFVVFLVALVVLTVMTLRWAVRQNRLRREAQTKP